MTEQSIPSESMVADITKILLKNNVRWPKHFSKKMKKRLYENLLEYHKDQEEYSICNKLAIKLKKYE